MNIYGKIRLLCKEQDISLAQLERSLGYSRNTLYQLGNNSGNSANKLIELADFFDVSIDYLLGRTENRSMNTTAPNNEFLNPNSIRNINITNHQNSSDNFHYSNLERKLDTILLEVISLNKKVEELSKKDE